MPGCYNCVGIDPSIISTAVVINSKIFNYCRKRDATIKSGKWNKWFELCKDQMEIKFIDIENIEGYSDNEINKLKSYDIITNQIISDIIHNIDPSLPIKVAIESFSYNSPVGVIVDLVAFSTLLRIKLLELTDDIDIISPSSLKLESCKMTYPPINIGKKTEKLEWRNNQGIKGGSFTKTDMFLSLVENEDLNDKYCTFLKENKEFILTESSKIPKPLEDTNDAYLLMLYLIKK